MCAVRCRRFVLAVVALVFVLGLGSPAAGAAQADGPAPVPASARADDLINPDRPGIADGSQVIGRHRVQLEVGGQWQTQEENGASTRASFLPVLLRVGLTTRLEGRVETNAYEWEQTTEALGEVSIRGWTPASIGIKYQFVDTKEWPTIGTIVRVFPASGSGEIRTHGLTGDVRLAADADLSRTVSLNPNVGIARYEDTDGKAFTATQLALTLSYSPSNRVMSFVDVSYQRPADAGGSSSVIVDGGLGCIVGGNVQLDASVGGGALGPAPRFFVALGISIRAGR